MRDAPPSCAEVASFDELVSRPMAAGKNALCWPRTLAGDFREVAHALAPADGLVSVSADELRALSLGAAGRLAADAILEDIGRLDALGYDPVVNCITSYPRDARGLPIATDVHSFHVDRSPIEVDTWLCTYWGKSSEGLAPGDAVRLIDTPAVRATLLQHTGGTDDEAFRAFIEEGHFDLHFRAADGARPFSFGVGSLWRLAVAWPGCPVPACVHRAPEPTADDEPRLLLIC